MNKVFTQKEAGELFNTLGFVLLRLILWEKKIDAIILVRSISSASLAEAREFVDRAGDVVPLEWLKVHCETEITTRFGEVLLQKLLSRFPKS